MIKFVSTLKKSRYVVPEIADGISDSTSFDEALDIKKMEFLFLCNDVNDS